MTRLANNSKVLKYEIVMLRGESVIDEGTIAEVAARRKVQPETLRFYLTRAYERRLARRKNLDNSITVVRTDEEEDLL